MSATEDEAVRAFQLVQWQKPPELREVAVPEPGPGQILVKVGGAGACHSDLHLMQRPAPKRPIKLPFTLGHENAGWVDKLGSGATGFAPGDPVIVYGPWAIARTSAVLPAAAGSAVTTAAWLPTCSFHRRASSFRLGRSIPEKPLR